MRFYSWQLNTNVKNLGDGYSKDKLSVDLQNRVETLTQEGVRERPWLCFTLGVKVQNDFTELSEAASKSPFQPSGMLTWNASCT